VKVKFLNAAVISLVLSVCSFTNIANAGLIFDNGSNTTYTGGLCASCGPAGQYSVFDDFTLTESLTEFYLDWDASFSNSASGFAATSIVWISIWENANANLLSSISVNYSDLDLISTNLVNGSDTNSTVGTNITGVNLSAGTYWISFSGTDMHFDGSGNAFQIAQSSLGNGTAPSHGNLATFRMSSIDVPEPSTLAIFALGMIGLASRRFKKQS
jgi:hypothetical protein